MVLSIAMRSIPVAGVGAIYVLAGLSLLFLLREPLERLDKPGSRGFILAVIAISLWPIATGVNVFVDDLGASMGIWNLRLLAAGLASVGWFLLAYEFTTLRFPNRWVLLGFAGYLLVGQLIAWTNPIHFLVLGEATTVENGVLRPSFGPWFWIQTTINYSLIIGATALLATDYVHSRGLRRRQTGLLTLAVVPPIAANLMTIFELVDTAYDLTPFGLIGSGIILSWSLYRLEFLNVVPIGRDTAVEVMEDAVVIFDADERVIDCNEAAHRLFDVDETDYGKSMSDFFGTQLRGAQQVSENGSVDANDGWWFDEIVSGAEVQCTVQGQRKEFSLTRSVVTGTVGTPIGEVLVFRDITGLKQREAELELIRQVLSRVLRHNLRTDLNVIEGYADLLADDYDDERIDRIIYASGSLKEIGEKTRDLERIVSPDSMVTPYDLVDVITDAITTVRADYPNVAVTYEGPRSCEVVSLTGLPIVIENLIENAVEHNTTEDPRVQVRIETTDESIVVNVIDNGPGLPMAELTVLESRRETSLRHGSGIGLWIVNWWADRSKVTLDFHTGEKGTTASITFPGDGGSG